MIDAKSSGSFLPQSTISGKLSGIIVFGKAVKNNFL
jgi:hypothetical protein